MKKRQRKKGVRRHGGIGWRVRPAAGPVDPDERYTSLTITCAACGVKTETGPGTLRDAIVAQERHDAICAKRPSPARHP